MFAFLPSTETVSAGGGGGAGTFAADGFGGVPEACCDGTSAPSGIMAAGSAADETDDETKHLLPGIYTIPIY